MKRLSGPIRRYAFAIALTALATGIVALVRLGADVTNVAMLYLLAVLATAVLAGTGPAILAAFAAFVSFNFFFVTPNHTLIVSDEEEWLSLGLLLVTGVVTGRLAAALRDRAREAERRERDTIVLYDTVRLMAEPELERALTAVAERLRTELAQSAVAVSFGAGGLLRAQADTGDPESIRLSRDALALSDRVLAGGRAPTGESRGETGRWIKVVSPAKGVKRSDRVRRVPITLEGEEVGALILVSEPGAPPFAREEDRLLSVLASQLGRSLERFRLQREVNESEILRRTDELRTALMNAVSHDLRTPLSSIIASAGSLLQQDVDWTDAEKRDFLHTIEQEAQRLNRLVGNLLDLSRIEAGSLHPEKAWYDLASLVSEVVGRFHVPAESHDLVTDLPDRLPPIEFDYVEIDEVLTNLVENAVKYTPAGSRIVVAAKPAGDTVEVSVADSGPGIPAGALTHLFDAFYRVPSTAGNARGSGLGLAVARGLIEAHGGRIWAENRPEGGARFTFTLPAPALANAIAEEIQA